MDNFLPRNESLNSKNHTSLCSNLFQYLIEVSYHVPSSSFHFSLALLPLSLLPPNQPSVHFLADYLSKIRHASQQRLFHHGRRWVRIRVRPLYHSSFVAIPFQYFHCLLYPLILFTSLAHSTSITSTSISSSTSCLSSLPLPFKLAPLSHAFLFPPSFYVHKY
jgi:hypothetical protein